MSPRRSGNALQAIVKILPRAKWSYISLFIGVNSYGFEWEEKFRWSLCVCGCWCDFGYWNLLNGVSLDQFHLRVIGRISWQRWTFNILYLNLDLWFLSRSFYGVIAIDSDSSYNSELFPDHSFMKIYVTRSKSYFQQSLRFSRIWLQKRFRKPRSKF